MTDAKTWGDRVAAWRASGLTAEQFCAGKDFNAKRLWWWSSNLRRRGASVSVNSVPIARVVRANRPPPVATAHSGTDVVVELGGAQVRVSPGADRETLEIVFAVLDRRRGEAK